MSLPRFLYDSRLADGAPVASGTATGFAVENLTDWRPATKWQPDALPATVTLDLGAGNSATVDYWAVWGHDLNAQGATIELRRSNDGFAANDVLVDSVAPADDAPFVRYVTPFTDRAFRLRITGTTAPTLAIAALGEYLEIPRGLRQGVDPTQRQPEGLFNRSVTGNPIGRTIKYEAWRQQLIFEAVSWSFIRTDWLPAWRAHLRSLPFIFQWDHGNYPAELVLANNAGGSETPTRPGAFSDLAINLEGIWHDSF